VPARTPNKKITCKVCGAEFYPSDKWQINKQKLLLAEGADAHRFLIYTCKAYKKSDVQVIDFGGIDELRMFLRNLVQIMADFSKVKTLVIVRDAETNIDSAVAKISSALRNVSLPVPSGPFQFSSNNRIKTAFMLFPGPDENGKWGDGTLEELCLRTVNDTPLLKCVDGYLQCAEKSKEDLRHPGKSRLYAYLAGKDDHAGKRLGEAARDKVWKFNHRSMAAFKKIIQEM
jgi:hypothetical protein